MAVDYTPTMKPYEKVGAFRYWCQTTLPLVYDDSKSYLELLYSVIHYLNSTIKDVANMGDNIDALLEAYTRLQKYVNDYFDNLDVQEEINNKLDEMAFDGTLDNVLEPFVQTFVEGWLEEHITPTTPPLDNTFTLENAAANSKAVGDRAVLNMPLVTANNYLTTLPDMDDAVVNRIYGLVYANTQNMPANSPPLQITDTIMTLFTFAPGNNPIGTAQIMVNGKQVWYRRRYSEGTFTDWALINDTDYDYRALKNITVSNYETLLPDLDNAEINKVYTFLFNIGETNLPANYPDTQAEATLSVLITFKTDNTNFKMQLFFNNRGIKFRRQSDTGWIDWTIVARPVDNTLSQAGFSADAGEVGKRAMLAMPMVTVGSHATVLPDLNQAEDNRVYVFLYANMENMPLNMPPLRETDNTITLLTFSASNSDYAKTQVLFNAKQIWYRRLTGINTWGTWVLLNERGYDVIIGAGERYTKLKDGIAYAVQHKGSQVYVKDGTYDLISEFGTSYFENKNTTDDGILLRNGIHLVFSSNAFVTCDYTGSNGNVKEHFSPFLLQNDGDVTIENLNLHSRNTRYGIHDETAGQNISVIHKYLNCSVDHASDHPYYKQALGGGLPKSATIIIKDCYFKSNAPANAGTVSYHNANKPEARSLIDISGTVMTSDEEGMGNFRFGWYGASTKITDIKIHGCYMKVNPVIRYEVTGASTPKNARLIAYANQIGGVL